MGGSPVSTGEPRPDREDHPEREAGASATEPETPVSPQPPLIQRLPMGRLVLGLVLVALGVIWLLEALDLVSFSFLAVLPAALILVGVVLLAGARSGRRSGLIVLGIVLTVILTIASGLDIKLRGGAGERTERPASFAELEREYHLSAGQLTIDLREVLDFPPGQTTNLKASVGLGQLTIRLPGFDSLLAVSVKAHAGAGQVTLGNREESGVDVDVSTGFGQITGDQPRLTLDLSVGLGQIEVTQ